MWGVWVVKQVMLGGSGAVKITVCQRMEGRAQMGGRRITKWVLYAAWRARERSSLASLSMPMCRCFRRRWSSSTVSALGFTDACPMRPAHENHRHKRPQRELAIKVSLCIDSDRRASRSMREGLCRQEKGGAGWP